LFTYDEFFARLRVPAIVKCGILIMIATGTAPRGHTTAVLVFPGN
jgi:hypothetical protein